MANVPGRRRRPILSTFARLLIGVTAVFILLPALWAVAIEASLGDARATGTVVGKVRNAMGNDQPVIEFTPDGGTPVRIVSPVGSSDPERRPVGERVPVRYDPADPAGAVHDEHWVLYGAPTIVGMLGVLYLATLLLIRLGVAVRRRFGRAASMPS